MRIPRHRGRGASLFASFLVSALTTVALFFGLREAERRGMIGGAQTVSVPEVVGMTVEQAREVLAGRGLLLNLEAERSEPAVPAGAIAEQSPLAGSQAKTGAIVRAVVSTGATMVPPIGGLSLADAKAQLEKAGLVLGQSKPIPSAEVAEGRVVTSVPEAGAALARGATVDVKVSQGPSDVEVPKVKGERIARARHIITEAGFEVGSTRWGYSDYYDGSVVLKQSPEAGTRAAPGSKIDLVVNEPDY